MEFMTLIKSARSVRRFKQKPISMETLKQLVACVRYSPSGGNQQSLKIFIVNDNVTRAKIFPLIKWAGALKEWDGPKEDQCPMAYMIILLDKTISPSPGIDHGIAAQSIVLGARSLNLGACIIGAYDKSKLTEVLVIPDNLKPLLIIALGEQDEEIIIEDHEEGKSLSYYRDSQNVHHVPKRTVESLIFSNSCQ